MVYLFSTPCATCCALPVHAGLLPSCCTLFCTHCGLHTHRRDAWPAYHSQPIPVATAHTHPPHIPASAYHRTFYLPAAFLPPART